MSQTYQVRLVKACIKFWSWAIIEFFFTDWRKRIWPKGVLADTTVPRTKTATEITKLLAKTKLLSLVSDELRRMISSDTTRRGLLNLFDMFQYKILNKRLIYVIIENLLTSLFNRPQEMQKDQANAKRNQIAQFIQCLLSKSSRVKPEWRQQPTINNKNNLRTQQSTSTVFTIPKSKSIHNYVQC